MVLARPEKRQPRDRDALMPGMGRGQVTPGGRP